MDALLIKHHKSSELPIHKLYRHYSENYDRLASACSHMGTRKALEHEFSELMQAYSEEDYKDICEELLDIAICSLLCYKKITKIEE